MTVEQILQEEIDESKKCLEENMRRPPAKEIFIKGLN